MPRKRNPVAIAAGKLILAVQKECDRMAGTPELARAQKVMSRARTLLQAAQISSAANLLDGRSVAEYLDQEWVAMHPLVVPDIAAFVAVLSASEHG